MDWDKIADALRMDLYAEEVDWAYIHNTNSINFFIWRSGIIICKIPFSYDDKDVYTSSQVVNQVVDMFRAAYGRLGV
jgi:hypothetical protein